MIADLLAPGTIEALFPNGISRYAIGGLLVGLGTVVIYLGTGITAGASTFLESTLSYVSAQSRFEQYRPSRDWRVVFTVGIVGGAAVYALIYQGEAWALAGSGWTTEVQPWRLLLGGILVGIGTRIGKGCTSGHGICGVGSVSRTSLVGVVTFLIVAIVTANLVAAMGVSP
ncbi:YeeE/YedE family protein [Halorubrum sp. JWXQ-INN 858]|uniref:YeeE/YedE family protein n=1 Tax=Halorubrum sp. JWXQ-INN 858 TaxID=2690782 RepID=UPI00135BB391|nr:YeeE/YedE family protein [Halorubrum sp. JWXQ-INN 858]MWV65418.1 YeeE/YedE family protein [Halorubrum sp. JWXQ-INN 858]